MPLLFFKLLLRLHPTEEAREFVNVRLAPARPMSTHPTEVAHTAFPPRKSLEDFLGNFEELTLESGMASTGVSALALQSIAMNEKADDDSMMIKNIDNDQSVLIMAQSKDDIGAHQIKSGPYP